MRETLTRMSALAAVVAAGLIAAPVVAQQAPEQAPQQVVPEAAPPAAFSEDQLDAFAAAVRDVTLLQQEYGARIETASPDEAAGLRDEAVEAMVDAVEEQGLTPEEYNQILQAAQADPTLHAAIVERMQAPQ
jgi:hypothetical protein